MIRIRDVLIVGFNYLGVLVVLNIKRFKPIKVIQFNKSNNVLINKVMKGLEYLYHLQHQSFHTKPNCINLLAFGLNGYGVYLSLYIKQTYDDIQLQVGPIQLFSLLQAQSNQNLQMKTQNITQKVSQSIKIKHISYINSNLIIYMSSSICHNESSQRSNILILSFQGKENKFKIKKYLSLKEIIQNQNQVEAGKFSDQIIAVDQFELGKQNKVYAVLGRRVYHQKNNEKKNHNNHNPLVQFHTLTWFNSKLIQNSLNTQNKNKQQKAHNIEFAFVYPKKMHHKLCQSDNQPKSNLNIKVLKYQGKLRILLITGKLGQMILLNLLSLQLNPSRLQFHPYSLHDSLTTQPNPHFSICQNQKHYKDIYAIYRKLQDGKVRLYMLGTDHMLTKWQYNNLALVSLITYKFLTASPQQVLVSDVDQQVYVKLRDSNIRSFPINQNHTRFLNQFWKQSVKFQVSKLVMHPTEIGLAGLLTKDHKILIYDLHEQRLMKIIQLRQLKKKKQAQDKYKSKQKQKSPKKAKQPQQTQLTLQPCQVLSISFQHKSIIPSLLLTSYIQQNLIKTILTSLYSRNIDKNIILLIQTQTHYVLVWDLNAGKQFQKVYVIKKIYKLERIFGNTYCSDGVILVTKKQGDKLKAKIVNKIINNHHNQLYQQNLLTRQKQQKQQKQQNKTQLIYGQVILSSNLGQGSRYIFKLTKITKQFQILIIINYKGTKMIIKSFFIHKKYDKQLKMYYLILSQLLQTEQFGVQNSFQIQNILFDNHNNLNNKIIRFIVYNKRQQTLKIINCKNLIELVQNQLELIQRQFKFSSNKVLLVQNKLDFNFSQQQVNLTINKDNLSQNQLQLKNQNMLINSQLQQIKIKRAEREKIPLQILSYKNLGYKIQSLNFFNNNIIILGKDQSIRVLRLQKTQQSGQDQFQCTKVEQQLDISLITIKKNICIQEQVRQEQVHKDQAQIQDKSIKKIKTQ